MFLLRAWFYLNAESDDVVCGGLTVCSLWHCRDELMVLKIEVVKKENRSMPFHSDEVRDVPRAAGVPEWLIVDDWRNEWRPV